MPNVVTDPEIIRRVREAAGKGQGTQPAPAASPTGGRVVTDPEVIQAVKNRKRFNDAAAKKRQQILETGQSTCRKRRTGSRRRSRWQRKARLLSGRVRHFFKAWATAARSASETRSVQRSIFPSPPFGAAMPAMPTTSTSPAAASL